MKTIVLFCGRIDTAIGGMEVHRQAFCGFFGHDCNYRLQDVVTKSPELSVYNIKDKTFLPFSTVKGLLSYLNQKYNISVIFFNDGHWISEFAQIREFFLSSILIMRSGGNEFVKAELPDMNIPLRERERFWADSINETLDLIIANSNYTLRRMGDTGIKPEKITVIRGGVDIEQCLDNKKNKTENRKEFDAAHNTAGKTLFCTASRFVAFKGIMETLGVFAKLGQLQNWHILLIGEGPQKDRIVDFCKKSFSEENYTFLGMQNNPDTLKYISISDYLLNLSREELKPGGGGHYIHTETLGRTMMEAVCQGTPLIAADSGATEELFKENHNIGVLVKKDAGDLADVLLYAVNNKYKADDNDVWRYGWQNVFQKYTLLFSYKQKKERAALVCDLDGTIIHKSFSRDENLNSIKRLSLIRDKGCCALVNTARSFQETRGFFDGIDTEAMIFILGCGSEIRTGAAVDSIWSGYINKQAVLDSGTIQYFTGYMQKNNISLSDKRKINDYYLNCRFDYTSNSTIKSMPDFEEFVSSLNSNVINNDFLVINNSKSIKLISKRVNKHRALEYVRKRYLPEAELIGIGNGTLDTLFIRRCDLKYFVNGKPDNLPGFIKRSIANYGDLMNVWDELDRAVEKTLSGRAVK